MTSQNHMHIFTSYPRSLALFVRSRNKFQLWMALLRATLPHTQTDVFEICHSSHLCFWFFWVSWHPYVDACHVLPLRVFLQVHSPSVTSLQLFSFVWGENFICFPSLPTAYYRASIARSPFRYLSICHRKIPVFIREYAALFRLNWICGAFCII